MAGHGLRAAGAAAGRHLLRAACSCCRCSPGSGLRGRQHQWPASSGRPRPVVCVAAGGGGAVHPSRGGLLRLHGSPDKGQARAWHRGPVELARCGACATWRHVAAAGDTGTAVTRSAESPALARVPGLRGAARAGRGQGGDRTGTRGQERGRESSPSPLLFVFPLRAVRPGWRVTRPRVRNRCPNVVRRELGEGGLSLWGGGRKDRPPNSFFSCGSLGVGGTQKLGVWA